MTDVRTSDAFSTTASTSQELKAELEGKMIYRAGSGEMVMYHVKDNGMPDPESGVPLPTICSYYVYVSGGVQAIDFIRIDKREDNSFAIKSEAMNYNMESHLWNGMQNTYDYVTGSNVYGFKHPMPGLCLSGDSGSPSWIWDEASQSYQYFGAMASGESCAGAIIGSGTDWMPTILEKYNVNVNLGKEGTHTVTFGAVDGDGGEFSGLDNNGNTLTIQKKMGSLTYTDINGESAEKAFCGVQSGVNTWNDLANRKDLDNWFNYGGEYLNSGRNVQAGSGKIDQGELLQTNNIVLTAADSATYSLKLDATVDTGIGYLRLSKAEGVETARFELGSGGKDDNGQDFQLNTAGFVVDCGVTLDISLTADANYMREWRKVGAGDLVISGTGNNNVLLNIGGNSEGANDGKWTSAHREGRVILDREGGYAAYNVLASTGSTVVLQGGLGQVKRNITLGAGGAVLDLHGNSYEWNNSDTSHFSLFMMAEGDTLANYSGSATVTVKDTSSKLSGISPNFIGAFEDSAEGELDVVYDGGSGTTWTMNTVFTDLSHNSGSSFAVNSGEVVLQGTLTQHAKGSESGRNGNRLVRDNDWHYAHAKMKVEVRENAKFTLGSHAFLEGNVQVNAGGTFELHQAVNHAQEYVEGGTMLEDVAKYSDHYGLSQGSTVNNAGKLHVKYDAGTDANTTFKGKLTGGGAVVFEMGTDGGTFTLANADNDFSGTKKIESGGLIATSKAALGNVETNKYEIGEKGFLALKDTAWTTEAVKAYVKGTSAGVLALTQEQAAALSTEDIPGLIIGAVGAVTYGTKESELAAVNGKWRLGGGGGTLTVDFRLNNANADLELGNAYTKGTVILTNTGNRIGNIIMYGGVTLQYTTLDALGDSRIKIAYGNRLTGANGIDSAISTDSDGILLIDTMSSVDLRGKAAVSLGVSTDTTYSGALQIDNGAAYHLGGGEGRLTLQTKLEGGHDLVVDAQGFAAGDVVLDNASSSIDGSVVITGGNTGKVEAGSIKLVLGSDNQLSSATGVQLQTGATLEVAGTNQILNNLNMQEGSILTDSFSSHGEVKASGTVILNGTISTDSLNITGSGTVASAATEASLGTLTAVSDGAVLEIASGGVSKDVNMANSTLKVADAAVSGTITASNGLNALINTGTGAVTLKGSVTVADGSSFSLTGSSFNFTSLKYNSTAGSTGTISVGNTRLDFSNGGGTTIGGSLDVQEGATATLFSSGSKDNMTRSINALNIGSGAAVNLTAQSWNTVWNIHSLSGEGDLNWNAMSNHWYSSRLILDGDNSSFTGNITVNRNGNTQQGRNYQAFIELANDKAAASATVAVNGSAANKMAALAINTDNAEVGGLNGNAYSATYAGAAVTGASDDSESLANAAVSTAAHTLTITGDGGTYSGAVNAGENGNGLSLVMNGTGTQRFDGASVSLNGVEVKAGTLELAAGQLTVAGDIDVRGGRLYLGLRESMDITGDVTLNGGTLEIRGGFQEGKSITVQSGSSTLIGDVDMALTVNSGASLALSNGTVSSMISNLGSISLNSDVFFTVAESELRAGNSVLLISGENGISVDFSLLNTDNIKVNGYSLSEYTGAASYSSKNGSLYLNFGSQMAQDLTWNGSTESHTWDLGTTKDWKTAKGTASGASRLDRLSFTDAAGVSKDVTVVAGAVADELNIAGLDYSFTGGFFSVNKDMNVTGSATMGAESSIGGNLTVIDLDI